MLSEEPPIVLTRDFYCRLLRRNEVPPEGALILHGPRDLVGMTAREMDEARKKILCLGFVPPSTSVDEAAEKLYNAAKLGATAPFRAPKFSVRPGEAEKPRTRATTAPVELIELCYVPGQYAVVDAFYKKLPPQARTIMDILEGFGKKVITHEEVVDALMEQPSMRESSQSPELIYKFYRTRFFKWKLAKRLSWEEYASDPRFRDSSQSQV